MLDLLLVRTNPPPPAMPPRKRRQAGAPAQGGDGDGAGPGPSSERAAAAAAGLLDVLEFAALVDRLDRESKRALRMASRAACAAVERMATCMELQASAQHDTVALRRLAGKRPNVHSLTCCSNKEGAAGFVEAAGLLGEFAASRPGAAAGVRIVHLELALHTLGSELPVLLAPFGSLQVRYAPSRSRRVSEHFSPTCLCSMLDCCIAHPSTRQPHASPPRAIPPFVSRSCSSTAGRASPSSRVRSRSWGMAACGRSRSSATRSAPTRCSTWAASRG